MKTNFDVSVIQSLRKKLDNHPIYSAVNSMDDLRLFMSHHVFSVWDFMSVVKYLQREIAPSSYPWVPLGNPSVRYFINQLVLEEESDQAPNDPQGNSVYASHFELYCNAMREVGADPTQVLSFLNHVAQSGIAKALELALAPKASREFMGSTFDFISTGKPHVVAAAFALGREHIIPGMFRSFLQRMGITEQDAPIFHFYLECHIHLDGDFHGPISLQLLEVLCAGDPVKYKEAEVAACAAVEARIRFWDGILEVIKRGTHN